MKELSFVEMNEVAGGYVSMDYSNGVRGIVATGVSNTKEAVRSAALGGAIGVMGGTYVGGTRGGEHGGNLGLGLIGQGVGAVVGGVVGGLSAGVAAVTVGWDTTFEYTTKAVDGLIHQAIN
ncbi:TPA: hypothetical protein ACKP06_003347 [Serratia marcescens]|uniref:hypothetical protein n=1 Tax=Serratia ureilytica TaxID=300181 RepID=UPI0018D9FF4E|nr:hypothetical protein [Serratia ureilytica]